MPARKFHPQNLQILEGIKSKKENRDNSGVFVGFFGLLCGFLPGSFRKKLIIKKTIITRRD